MANPIEPRRFRHRSQQRLEDGDFFLGASGVRARGRRQQLHHHDRLWGCEVHLTQAGTGPWRVSEENNPFGVFIRTPDVDAIAARVDDLIIRPGGVLRHREWGLYEVGICGHDGMLVRIGWPKAIT